MQLQSIKRKIIIEARLCKVIYHIRADVLYLQDRNHFVEFRHRETKTKCLVFASSITKMLIKMQSL